MLLVGGKTTAGPAVALTAAALLFLLLRSVEAACPNLHLKTKVAAKAKKLAPGSPFVLAAVVVNKGTSILNDLGIGLYLSNGLCRVKPSFHPERKHPQTPTVAGNNLYWAGLALKPGKAVRARIRGLINPQFTAPDTVTVGAVAWSASANCTVTAGPRTVSTCIRSSLSVLDSRLYLGRDPLPSLKLGISYECFHSQPLQMSVQAAEKPLSKALPASKTGQCGLNPVPDPIAPYSLYAAGQRCAQAQLVSVGGRRQLEWGEMDTARRLQVTADSCWAACANQGYAAPFYMNLYNTGGQMQCYW